MRALSFTWSLEQLSIAEDAHTLEHCSGHISILGVCFSQYCRDQAFQLPGVVVYMYAHQGGALEAPQSMH